MEYFDSHAHYNDEKFLTDKEEVIKKLYQQNITKIVCAGYNIPSSKEAIQIANNYSHIYTTCGISPNDINKEVDKEIIVVKEMAQNEKVVAIGEIGLDYYWNKENKELQKQYFIKQIALADELKLPIVVHTRDAVLDTITILKQYTPNQKGVIHCCPLNKELVKEALKLGFYISFAGPITFKNSKNADEIIQMVPLENTLIETDSPYLSPEPNRGKRNDSSNLKYIAQKIATVKQINLNEVIGATYKNACRIFAIEEKEQ